jgi:uncharacterized membrane protein YeaQ/YmgE (transglycosylase-associated protein family)
MDPNSVLFALAAGAVLGIVLGFMVSGEGYGWFFNGLAGALGAAFGGQWLAHSAVDLGPFLNVGVAALVASSLTALVLRT